MGRSRQPSRFISVVLPEPEAPIKATNSPASMDNETSFSTGTSTSPRRYVLSMFAARSEAWAAHARLVRNSLLLVFSQLRRRSW